VIEVPTADVLAAVGGDGLVAAVAESVVMPGDKVLRIERLGRAEIKNFILAGTARDPRYPGVEVRDLYNREDSFAPAPTYLPLYTSRFDAQLSFFDSLDDHTAWPLVDGRHPLRDVLLADFLVLDTTRGFTPGTYLEHERALLAGRPATGMGGRWLDDDIVDEMLSLYVSGDATRVGDGVPGPTVPASTTFPYLTEPIRATDLQVPTL
jgi:hypothetical protein